MSSGEQVRRARKAAAVVVFIVALTLAACFWGRANEGGASGTSGWAREQTEDQDGEGAGLAFDAWKRVAAGEDMRAVLAGEGYLAFGADEAGDVPPWFEQEVVPLGMVGDGVATQDWAVVGFSAEGSVSEALEDVCLQLTSRGWTGYASGEDGLATFTKEGGVCSWAMVSCVANPDGVGVVMQIRHA